MQTDQDNKIIGLNQSESGNTDFAINDGIFSDNLRVEFLVQNVFCFVDIVEFVDVINDPHNVGGGYVDTFRARRAGFVHVATRLMP